MRGSDGDGHHTHVEAAVEGADEVDPRWIDERHVVPGVEAPLLQQQTGDLLRPLVQLGARQRLGGCAPGKLGSGGAGQ